MKHWYLLFALLSCAPLFAQNDRKPKLANFHPEWSKTYISVDGVWEPDVLTKKTELVYAVVRFECFKGDGSSETRCIVATATPVPSGAGIHLDIAEFFGDSISWNEDHLIISEKPNSLQCQTSVTMFDMHSGTVTGVDTKIAGRKNMLGEKDLCALLPERVTYYLRDQVDYILNHKKPKE